MFTILNGTKRLRGDLIELFTILNGYDDVDSNMFFKLKEYSMTTGQNYS